MKQIRSITLFLLLSLPVAAQLPLSDRIANYRMEVRLDVAEKKLYGKTSLEWRNPGSGPVGELLFHMYYNAFKNSESTFMKESGNLPDFFFRSLVEECGWGWTKITKIRDHDGHELGPGMEYVQPDDGNPLDETVLRVPLHEPVDSSGTVFVEFTWEARIPKSVVRTGYNKDFYFFAQWFPKLGVYEPAGTRFATEDSWNCHQYHALGEYYADFGTYDVSLTVPNDFILGASGTCVKKESNGTETTWTYHVEDVIDFAWTASPHFTTQKEKWKDVEITLLTYPEHSHFEERYFRAAQQALSFMDTVLGKYPYQSLTIVDPPIHGIFTGGMEYPTLITSLSSCFLPRGLNIIETLVTHEFIHQYFMQMVATNEQEEPWLDEGLTTYYEGRILDHFGGENASFVNLPWLKIGSTAYNRWEYFRSPFRSAADLTLAAREYPAEGFGEIVYNKTAIWLKTLENLIGREAFDKAMKAYFEKWKFGHPDREDFIDVFSETVRKTHGKKFGPDLDWFFDQVIYSTKECDYAVGQITNREVLSSMGYVGDTNECATPLHEGVKPKMYRSSVMVRRLGEMTLPVEVEIEMSDGHIEREMWDGVEQIRTFEYTSPNRIVTAEIDPERKIWIDRNFLNNRKSERKEPGVVRMQWLKALHRIQNLMESITGIF